MKKLFEAFYFWRGAKNLAKAMDCMEKSGFSKTELAMAGTGFKIIVELLKAKTNNLDGD